MNVAELKQKWTARVAIALEPQADQYAREFLADLESLAAQQVVAYLHTVVMGDGEPDQALSFSPDNFPLEGTCGYRSLGSVPLYSSPAAVEVTDAVLNIACDAYNALPHTWPSADREGMRAALTAALRRE